MYTITGGSGFVGEAIAKRLLDEGQRVALLVRQSSRVDEVFLAGAKVIRVNDFESTGELADHVQGSAGIFHAAAHAALGGRYATFRRANVAITETLLKAAERAHVPAFVYTSTPSVVHSGDDLSEADESTPYAKHFVSHYARTKAIAEALVLGHKGFTKTVALRPHLIVGDRDRNLFPRIAARARANRLALIGDGSNLIDVTPIDICVDAHLGALRALTRSNDSIPSGKSYFVANDDPQPVRLILETMLRSAGISPNFRQVPFGVAYPMAAIVEGLYRAFRPDQEPPVTRFLVEQLATKHTYNLRAAQRDLGFEPGRNSLEFLADLRPAF